MTVLRACDSGVGSARHRYTPTGPAGAVLSTVLSSPRSASSSASVMPLVSIVAGRRSQSMASSRLNRNSSLVRLTV